MATLCNTKGVTIIEVDGGGQIVNATPGFGQGWRAKQQSDCGSQEWLSEIVLSPDPGSLQKVIDQVAKGGLFQGAVAAGTSCTSCRGAVYRLGPKADAPQPAGTDYKYYVLAQGVWIDKMTGQPLSDPDTQINDNSQYLTSSFIISEYPIDQIKSLAAKWNKLKAQALQFFLTLSVK
jgi:hypothetical protein